MSKFASMRDLPKLRDDGRYAHVYDRELKKVQNLTDESKRVWYQPMFKRRHTEVTEQGKKSRVTWFGRLGSYWDPAVAAVAAEMAAVRYDKGESREAIECVENDILEAAREYARVG